MSEDFVEGEEAGTDRFNRMTYRYHCCECNSVTTVPFKARSKDSKIYCRNCLKSRPDKKW